MADAVTGKASPMQL